MSREQLFGRLIAIATVLGDRVIDKGTPSIASKYLDKLGKDPQKIIMRLHRDLMQYTHKFGDEEMVLLDMFGELMAQLDADDFNDNPLGPSYLQSYYAQKVNTLVGVAEAAEILGWDKRRVSVYIGRGKFPDPIQNLSCGPIWTKKQILDWSREFKK